MRRRFKCSAPTRQCNSTTRDVSGRRTAWSSIRVKAKHCLVASACSLVTKNDNHGHRRRPIARNEQRTCRRRVKTNRQNRVEQKVLQSQSVSAQPAAVSEPTAAASNDDGRGDCAVRVCVQGGDARQTEERRQRDRRETPEERGGRETEEQQRQPHASYFPRLPRWQFTFQTDVVDPRQLRKTVWVAPTPAFAPVAIYFPNRRSLKAETLVPRT